MVYRIAAEEDFLQLAELRWKHVEEEEDISAINKAIFFKKYINFLNNEIGKTYTCFVADENGKIISNIYLGMITKTPKPNNDVKSIGYITNVHTYAEYRNKGIGSRLMQEVKKYAEQQGCELLFVWPSTRAVPYYERAGFNYDNDIMECGLL